MALGNLQTNTSSADTCSINVAQGSGNNRIVVALLTENSWDSAHHASSCTLDGVEGSVIETSGGGVDAIRARAYYWLDDDLPASSGSQAITINGSAGNGRQLSAIYYTGANQAAPADPTTWTADFRGDASVTLTAEAGSSAILISMWIYNTGETVSLSSGESALINANQNNGLHVHSYDEIDLSLQHDYTAFEFSVAVAFAIEPAPAPSGTSNLISGKLGGLLTGKL